MGGQGAFISLELQSGRLSGIAFTVHGGGDKSPMAKVRVAALQLRKHEVQRLHDLMDAYYTLL